MADDERRGIPDGTIGYGDLRRVPPENPEDAAPLLPPAGAIRKWLILPFRMAAGYLLWLYDVEYGQCGRCGMPWWAVTGHLTPYRHPLPRKDIYVENMVDPLVSIPVTALKECFPLCEHCWSGLTVAERIPYYQALVDRWIVAARARRDYRAVYIHRRQDLPAILDAVRRGQ